jgi:uncharacterized protein (DUF1697 family)
MTGYVALLRAVNVGGRLVAMSELRSFAEELGFTEVRTFLNSGNLLFSSSKGSSRSIESELEREVESHLRLPVTFVVRGVSEWKSAIAANPFSKESDDDPSHLLVVFLKGPAASGAEERLRQAIRGRERGRVVGATAYVCYPEGIGTSKLTLPVIERAVGVAGTGRNWNTVTKIAEKLARPTG